MSDRLVVRLAVFVILRDSEGRLLLQQRQNTGYMDGHYDCACSGHVELGETLEEAALREVAEELGVSAQPQDLRLVHVCHNYLRQPYYANFVYELDRWEGTPEIREPEKCSDLSYFAPDALPEKLSPTLRSVVESGGLGANLTYSALLP